MNGAEHAGDDVDYDDALDASRLTPLTLCDSAQPGKPPCPIWQLLGTILGGQGAAVGHLRAHIPTLRVLLQATLCPHLLCTSSFTSVLSTPSPT